MIKKLKPPDKLKSGTPGNTYTGSDPEIFGNIVFHEKCGTTKVIIINASFGEWSGKN
jgi:hypothetical protein